MWHLGTWFSGGVGSDGLKVGFGDLKAFFNLSDCIFLGIERQGIGSGSAQRRNSSISALAF